MPTKEKQLTVTELVDEILRRKSQAENLLARLDEIKGRLDFDGSVLKANKIQSEVAVLQGELDEMRFELAKIIG